MREGWQVVIEPRCMHLIPRARGHITVEAGKISVAYDAESVEVSVPQGIEAALRISGREYSLRPGTRKCIRLA